MAQTKPTNMRLPPQTIRQLAEIGQLTDSTNQTAATVAAVAHFHDWITGAKAQPRTVVLALGKDGVSNLPMCQSCTESIEKTIGVQ